MDAGLFGLSMNWVEAQPVDFFEKFFPNQVNIFEFIVLS